MRALSAWLSVGMCCSPTVTTRSCWGFQTWQGRRHDRPTPLLIPECSFACLFYRYQGTQSCVNTACAHHDRQQQDLQSEPDWFDFNNAERVW
jgi:hypothetical protein